MDLSELDGKNILLILVGRRGEGHVQLALSKVKVTGSRIEARYSNEHPSIEIDAARALGAGGPAAQLPEFVAPISGAEEVLALAAQADRYLPLLITAPLPGLTLLESPFYGLTANGSRDLVLLRPATESERAVGRWNRGWFPEADVEEDEEDDESNEIDRALRVQTAEQARPRVSFYMSNEANEAIRRSFMRNLIAQRFPLYDAGAHADDPAGLRGWISLRSGTSRDEWRRLLEWLRTDPAIRELVEVVEEGLA